MEELKKQLVEACERKLDYYDVVNESAEQVEYRKIIDFLIEQFAIAMCVPKEVLTGRAEDENKI